MVTVYSRPTCGPCKTLFYWLDKKGIKYKKLSPEGTDVTIVPTVLIGAERIEGLNFRRLNELLIPASDI